MTFSAINEAIRTHVEQIGGGVAPVWWSIEFTPPVDQVHVRWTSLTFNTLPMEVGAHTVTGDNPPDETTGIVQMDIYVPVRVHPREAEQVADTIRAHFRGVRVPPVQFQTPRMLPVTREGDFTRHTIEIPWRAEDA